MFTVVLRTLEAGATGFRVCRSGATRSTEGILWGLGGRLERAGNVEPSRESVRMVWADGLCPGNAGSTFAMCGTSLA